MFNIKETSSISQRSYSALLWNYLGSFIRMSSQFLIGIVLARLLGPSAFGIVAVGLLMVSIGNLVADFGLSAAIIQTKNLLEKDIRFAFTAQVIIGLMLTILGCFSAEYIAIFFRYKDAESTIQVMSFLFVIQAFGQTSGAILRRNLNFKLYQKIGISSYLIGYLLIGIPSAYYGLGVWSLVAAQLTQSLLFSIFAVLHAKHSLMPTLRPESKGMFAFGGKVIGANLASWGILNFDSLVVGRLLGVFDLGIYNRAMTLIGTPINTITSGLQGVLFAASAQVQDNVAQLKRGYFASSSVITLISFPLAVTVAAIPDAIITAVYGEKWLAAIPVLPPLAMAMAVHAMLALAGPVLMAQNKVGLELRAQLVALGATLPVLYVSASHSLQAVAWGLFGIYILRCYLLVNALLEAINGKWSEFLRVLIWPVAFSFFISAFTFVCDNQLVGFPPFLRLLLDAVIALIAALLFFRIFGRKMLVGAHGDYLLGSNRLPLFFKQMFKL